MRIAEVGEFPLIERLQRIVAVDRSDIVVGIGDDAAVLSGDGDTYLLATVDAQVEGVHFLRHLSTPDCLGQRALAINVSDIAAMGGRPQFALVSLILPPDTELSWVEALYQGMRRQANCCGVALVGGNMSQSPGGISVDVTVLGHVRRDRLLLRKGARAGDRVLVTGHLGGAGAGLHLAREPQLALESIDATARQELLNRYLTPRPRVSEASIIAESRKATAMIDLSDGLSSDVSHLCDRSQVGVRIWAECLPMAPATRVVADLLAAPPSQLALAAGEDYELCFTAPPAAAETLISAVTRATGTPVTIVGEVLPVAQGRWLAFSNGRQVPFEPSGWKHFQPDT